MERVRYVGWRVKVRVGARGFVDGFGDSGDAVLVGMLNVGRNGCFDGRWDSEVCCGGAGACGNGCGDVRRWCDGELVKGIDLLNWGLVVVVVLSLLGEGDVVEESIYSSVLCVYDGEE